MYIISISNQRAKYVNIYLSFNFLPTKFQFNLITKLASSLLVSSYLLVVFWTSVPSTVKLTGTNLSKCVKV